MAKETLIAEENSFNNNAQKPVMKGNNITRFIDGAISGLISGAVLQPLQVIKTSM